MKKWLMSLFGLCFVLGRAAGSEIIYDNSSNYLADFNDTRLESGDEVRFAGTGRLIDHFSFEYFASLSPTPSGNETARVRFYLNDGPAPDAAGASPGTLLYDSDVFTISAGYQSVSISGLDISVPANTITWTVQFSGLSTNERAGLLFYDPPRVGSSDNFFWLKEATGWTAEADNSVTNNNFAARFTALPEVRISSLQISTNNATLVVDSTAGKSYSLEYKTDADQTGWQSLNAPSVLATTNQVTLTYSTVADNNFRIYRVVQRDTAP
jgi:hypothetical protein